MEAPLSEPVEPAFAAAAQRRENLQALRFMRSDDENLTADQLEVLRILGDMGRKHEERNGALSLPSTSSQSFDTESNSAMNALAALGQDDRITPPPLLALDQDRSGLPPTPPTLTNSSVSEAKPVPALSPAPHIFADRVRNALDRSHKSGFSTPVTEAHSPPTPDRSPPSMREALDVARPQLTHAYSSFAESFKTAKEGLSSRESMSQLQSPSDEQLPELNLLGVPRRPRIASSGSDTGTATQTDGSDNGPVRVKNYQMESDSDMDRAAGYQTGDSDEPMVSPTIQQALAHPSGYGYQHRLRAPINPGDDFKRLDNALLYGTTKWKPRVTAPPVLEDVQIERDPTPRREMDTEALTQRNALPERSETPIQIDNVAPEAQNESLVKSSSSPPTVAVGEVSPRITSIPESIPPPTTVAGQAILEGNNATYQIIQRENAKRYSAISDGSGVQAMIYPTPEQVRVLRHTPKRASLREDMSIASNSKRSSLDGSNHKQKPQPGLLCLGSDSDEAGSPRMGFDEFYRRSAKPVPIANVCVPLNRPQHKSTAKHGFRSLSGDTGADYLNNKATLSGHDGMAIAPRRAQTLRRSVRGRDLDRIVSSGDYIGKIPGLGMEQEADFPVHKLRRTSAEKRLCNLGEVRRTSLGRVSELSPSPALRRISGERIPDRNAGANRAKVSRSVDLGPAPHELRRSSIEQRLEKNIEARSASIDLESAVIDVTTENHDDHDHGSLRERRKSSDRTIPISPRRKSFDLRHLHPVETPLSISQFSGTEGELCEARGIEIFPHNNESLLLIHGNGWEKDVILEATTVAGAQRPMFQAFLEPPESSQTDLAQSIRAADSPLTNPRTAPEPPKLVFIPPTPVEELDRQVGDSESSSGPRKHLQRRTSLTAKVRRYSASLVQPIPFGRSNSFRRQPVQRPQTSPDNRPTHLTANWSPRYIWEGYSSDEEDDFPYDDRLPPGGDTSDVKEKRNSFFPRSMSVRMPGFRGHGGFLQGNSLGLDRHGTNNRRHYIRKRTSEEILQRMVERRRRRTFTLPFTGGTKVEYVGLAGIGARVRESKRKRKERAAEKRRDVLREQIGHPTEM